MDAVGLARCEIDRGGNARAGHGGSFRSSSAALRHDSQAVNSTDRREYGFPAFSRPEFRCGRVRIREPPVSLALRHRAAPEQDAYRVAATRAPPATTSRATT